MSKKIITSIMIIATILFSVNFVNAATGSVNLNASSTSVKPGDTFTVTVSVNCEDGINGIQTTYSYDETKLELKSANVASTNWSSLGVGNAIEVISTSTSKLTSEDIYVLTFQVKATAEVGTTATVSIGETTVDSDLPVSSDPKFTEGAKTVTINIVSEPTTGGDTGNQDVDDPNDDNGGNQPTTPDDNGGTTGDQNGNTQTGTTGNQNSNTQNGNTGSQSSNTQNNSANKNTSTNTSTKTDVANGKLPKTGESDVILMFIELASVCVMVSYIKMKKAARK